MNAITENSVFEGLEMPYSYQWWHKLTIGFVLLFAGLFAAIMFWISCEYFLTAAESARPVEQFVTAVKEGLPLSLLIPPMFIYAVIKRNAAGWMMINFSFFLILFCIGYACFSDRNFLDMAFVYLIGGLIVAGNITLMYLKPVRHFFMIKNKKYLWKESIVVVIPALALACLCGYLHLI
ncbi:MAG TPA: hypothetical protein PL009_14415 [Flavipsychrobacter sp.]|nr:hypothetical protein [Flavipsychrobacter sp.]